jgi:SAM-dependent methyltransferase
MIANQYDLISDEFNDSRVRIWNKVREFFVKHQKSNTQSLLDAGVGNGKNIIFANSLDYYGIGIDISEKLLDICERKGVYAYNLDILDLSPDKYGKFEKIISIAVLHHLDSVQSQIQAIVNMLNCLEVDGHLLVSVWSHEITNIFTTTQESIECRKFEVGPNLVNWNSKNKKKSTERYYYIHNFVSFYVMMCQVSEIVPISFAISWEKQNWFCEIHKL